MGYRGKLKERDLARQLRAQAWTMPDIAKELGVSRSSVSLWTRDVEFTPNPRRHNFGPHNPHPLHVAKVAEIERCRIEAIDRIGTLSDREFLVLGTALYAGEGAKQDGRVKFANSDPALVHVFTQWLRHFFEIDERRLRVGIYLHADLDLDAATRFWSELLAIPAEQFTKPYRAVVDETRRHNRHVNGCVGVSYADALVHRRVMGLVRAIVCDTVLPDLPG